MAIGNPKKRIVILVACASYAVLATLLAATAPFQGLTFISSFGAWLLGIPVVLLAYVAIEALCTRWVEANFWKIMPSWARVSLLALSLCTGFVAVMLLAFVYAGLSTSLRLLARGESKLSSTQQAEVILRKLGADLAGALQPPAVAVNQIELATAGVSVRWTFRASADGRGSVVEREGETTSRWLLGTLTAATLRSDDEDSAPVADLIGAEDQGFELVEGKLAIEQELPVLDDRERRVIGLRFGDDMTQSQIAAEIGCSQMQVSRILRRALDKLRERV